MRCVPQDLEYSSTRRPCAPCASEPAFKGRNLACCVPRGSSQRALRVGRLTRGAHLWCTSSTHRLPTPCRPEPAFVYVAEPDVRRSPRDSSQDQLRAQDLEYSSRPKARTAHVGPARLAHQNLLLVGSGTWPAAFRRCSRTSSTHRTCAPYGREPAFWNVAEPGQP